MNDTRTEDPAAIEADIRQTQDQMSRTVERIGNQLTPKNLFNALLDKAEDGNIDARQLLDGARRNPVALGLIAIGAIWLISEKDARIPSLPKWRKTDRPHDDNVESAKSWTSGRSSQTVGHADYISHMSAVERLADEDDAAYQRRRDTARSNFFMVERGHEEDESSFRKRLDSMAEAFRGKRRDWSEKAGRSRDMVGEKSREAAERAKAGYSDNPLIGGVVAAAVGAAFGSALPITRQEQTKLAEVGGKARGMIGEHKEQLTAQFREKKDQLLDQAGSMFDKNDKNANDDYVRADPIETGTSPTQVQA